MPLPIKIVFLGTSASSPTKERNLPSVAVEYEGSTYLFDCGEGTQRQLMQNSISPQKIKAIFITHMHGDHVIGVAGLIRTLALNKRTDPLEIFVPEGEEKKLMPLITFDKAFINYKIIIKGVRAGVAMKGRGFSVHAFKLMHSVPTYGYSFQEEGRVRFDHEKCKKLGIKGSMYSEIEKKGRIRVEGKAVSLKSVAKELKGRKIVYATDTRPTKTTSKISENAELLIHEATYADEFQELAKQRLHSTASEAAEVAKRGKAKMLIIFHMSARYKSPSALLKEARKVFKNTEAAYDGMVITL